MTNINKYMFFSMTMMGTFLIISSQTWLSVWMGLEINMMSFIPIIYNKAMMKTHESCMIYFLIQSMGSIIMLISILMNFFLFNFTNFMENLFYTMLGLSMILKMGAAPFHSWIIGLMENMNWPSCFILITWQKIAPLYILSLIYINETFLSVMISVTVIFGSIGGLSTTSIRKIMGYSSMDHLGWMMTCMMFGNNLWMFYLFIYSLILLSVIYTFWFYSTFYMNQYTNKSLNFPEKFMIISSFMSLGGLPPFLGFLPKLIVIQLLILNNSYILPIILILTTLITLFYYLRLISSILLINSSMTKWEIPKGMDNVPMACIITVNSMFPLIGMFWF